MRATRIVCFTVLLAAALPVVGRPEPANSPIPPIPQLMREVQEHQRQLEKIRENYTFSSLQTIQDLNSNGQIDKTETREDEDFFVNGHIVERTVKKNGQPLSEHDQEKETERVTKLVEKAEKTPPEQPLEGPSISISRILELMDVRNPRRENWHGRTAIVFDFVGRKDAKTHGLAEDASKKLQGTLWIDEADRQVAHLEVSFIDNFHVTGGLFANVQRGSSFRFDQTQINGEVWLPTGAEATMQARLLLVKNLRQHFTEKDYDYKRFHVETQQSKDAKAVVEKAP